MQTVPRYKAAPQQFDFGAKQEYAKQDAFGSAQSNPYAIDSKHEQKEQYAPSSAHAMPIKTFRSGSLNVSIWENETLGQDNLPKTYKTVSFDRRYKDKSGVWKSTNSLRLNDLPRATLILQKAYEYLILTESHDDVEA